MNRSLLTTALAIFLILSIGCVCAVELHSTSSHSGIDHKYYLSALYDGGDLYGIVIQIPEFPQPIHPINPMGWNDDFDIPGIYHFSDSLFSD